MSLFLTIKIQLQIFRFYISTLLQTSCLLPFLLNSRHVSVCLLNIATWIVILLLLSVTKECTILCDLKNCSMQSLCPPPCQTLLRFMSIELLMLYNHLFLCCPLSLLPSVFPSIRVFPNESALHIRWPKCWSFSKILPMNIQGWFPLGLTSLISLLSQEISSLLQHNFKATIQLFL